MNLDNFIVRPRRKVVEKYQKPETWQHLTDENVGEIQKYISDLPTEAEPIEPREKDEELALRFDHMLLTMQLAMVEKTGISDYYRDKLVNIAAKLESKTSVPAIAEEVEWLEYIQSANFWTDLTLDELEQTRKRLRLLMRFMDKEGTGYVYTN